MKWWLENDHEWNRSISVNVSDNVIVAQNDGRKGDGFEMAVRKSDSFGITELKMANRK